LDIGGLGGLRWIYRINFIKNFRVHTIDEAMKLSICNLILESQTSPYYVADYLLYYMNK